jgi:hypothetical protein
VPLGIFTCCKTRTQDRQLYFPSDGRRAEDFFTLKNPTASAGFEPANLGTKGQHATPRPLKPVFTWQSVIKIFFLFSLEILFYKGSEYYDWGGSRTPPSSLVHRYVHQRMLFRLSLGWVYSVKNTYKIWKGMCSITPLTLILLMWRIWWDLNNASKWQMGFNSVFKGLMRLKSKDTEKIYWKCFVPLLCKTFLFPTNI